MNFILDNDYEIGDKVILNDWQFKIVSIIGLPNETVKRFKGITIDGKYYVSGIIQGKAIQIMNVETFDFN